MTIAALILNLLFFFYQGPEPYWQLFVNGSPAQLHSFPGGAFSLFEVDKPVNVEIRTGFYVRWVDVRPRSAGITTTVSGNHNVVRFQVTRAVPLTIEFNGDWRRVLHLFAYAPEKDPVRPGAPNVRYYGPGEHEAGVIELKDNETLYLAPGAWVKGVVRSYGAKNIRILGRGVLDASILGPPPGSTAAGRGQATAGAQTRPAAPVKGPRNVIYLEKTQGAKVEGITLVNAVTWTFYLRGATNTHIEGVRLLSYSTGCGTDGIDIVSSSNTLVENSFVRSNDDCIAVKNLDDIDQHDITVRRCVFWNMPCGNGVEIGFEMRSRKTERVRFEDIDIIRVERGAAISIHNGDSALIQDVVFNNIRVEDARHKLIDFAVVYGRYGAVDRPDRSRPSDPGGAWDGVLFLSPEERAMRAKDRGIIRNVLVRNLHVVEGAFPYSIISGFDKDHPVENVTIENLRYLGRPVRTAQEAKISIDHAPGFRMR